MAAEMNRGLAVSAETTRLPSFRATSLSGGSCSFFLTSADWAPAVERPSSQAHPSMMLRKSATSFLLRTLGMQISIASVSEPCRDHQRGRAAGGLQHKRRRTLIPRGVIELVEDIVDEQLELPVLVDLRLREGIEAPEARQRCALVCGKQGASVDLGTIDGLSANLPRIVDLIFAEHAEGLICDIGKRQADVCRVQCKVGRRNQRLRHLRFHQDQAAEHAPSVGDLARHLEIHAVDFVSRTGADTGNRADATGWIGTTRNR